MNVDELSIGDVVYAAETICDYDYEKAAKASHVLARPGNRGVVTLIGRVLEQPERSVVLVRFEDEYSNLGAPVGCMLNDIATKPIVNH
jgi:nitrogen fixation protein NifZ